jgi:putative ABC transport system permease protein
VNLGEAARSAAREIRVHKVRSLLSFSAISVGAASLLYTLAQTRGMQEALRRNLELMGPGALTVSAKEHYTSRGLSKGLTAADAAAIRAEMPELYMVSPTARSWNARPVFEGKRLEGASAVGVEPEWSRRNWVYALRGRFLNETDVREAARVCLVVEPGGWFKKPFWAAFWNSKNEFNELVSRRDMLGRRLKLGGHDFLIVGTLKLPPRDLDPRWEKWGNPSVVLPLTSYGAYLAGNGRRLDAIDQIHVDTGDEGTLGAARHRIEQILALRHRGEKDFEVKSDRQDLEDSIRDQNKDVAVALALGIVALLSGGIGILNVTLAAVYSRMREIGVRRALGAERADVLALFVAEAALLGLAGGVAGVLLGAYGIDRLAKAADRDVIELAWYHAAGMVALSAAVAAVFSAYPAWLASRLDPVEAMREES